LLDSTANTLQALETVFELEIDCSGSSIDVAPSAQNENLRHFGNGPLYVVSTSLAGGIEAGIVYLMRSDDFAYLGKVMKPVLTLMFMPDPDTDPQNLESKRPKWMQDGNNGHLTDAAFRSQMLDALAEMGNVLTGLYSKSIFKICNLNTHHSVPLVMKDPYQKAIQRVLFASEASSQHHIAIENEFFLNEIPIKLWCLITPTWESFRDMLKGIDLRNKYQN